MSNRVISIEIGLQKTKICEVDYNKKNPHVYNCITFQTPENTFEDGYIRDKLKFVAVTKEKMKEANIKSTKVIFTITSTKIANREVTIPLVKDNRIQDVIDANASEYFPVEISEYAISYSVIERISTKEEKKLKLSVLAAPNNLIKNYYNVAEMLGYEVEAIDYIGNSTVQLFKKQIKSGTNLIIQINEQSTLISILEEEVLTLQRTVPYGTTSAIQAVLDNEYFNIDNENEALLLLCSNELINIPMDSYNEEAAVTVAEYNEETIYQNEQTGKMDVTESLSNLISNIRRVLDYYTSKNKDKVIHTIYMTGQGSRFLGIGELLYHETGIVAKRMNSLSSVIFNKDLDLSIEDQIEYFSCIGATMNPIHFVPKEYAVNVKENLLIHNRKVIIGTSIALSLILVVTGFVQYGLSTSKNHSLKEKINNLGEVNAIYEAHTLAMAQHTQIKKVYDLTQNPNVRLKELLTVLEEKLPTKATVEALDFTESDISLSFQAESKETAAKVLQQLKTISEIIEINTNEIRETKNGNGINTVQFQVTGKYKDTVEEDVNGDHE